MEKQHNLPGYPRGLQASGRAAKAPDCKSGTRKHRGFESLLAYYGDYSSMEERQIVALLIRVGSVK